MRNNYFKEETINYITGVKGRLGTDQRIQQMRVGATFYRSVSVKMCSWKSI